MIFRLVQHHNEVLPKQGPNEVALIWEKKLLPLLQGTARQPAIFSIKPHVTVDNFFSGDEMVEFAADNGFGLIVTCRRDRLPRGVPGKYFHKEKTSVNERSRAARYEKPIVAVKKRGQSVVAHVSFQSTSSCNFSCVNSLNSCSLYAQTKEKGRGAARRQWAIEMNEA